MKSLCVVLWQREERARAPERFQVAESGIGAPYISPWNKLRITEALQRPLGLPAWSHDDLFLKVPPEVSLQIEVEHVSLTLPFGRQVQLQLHGEPGKIRNDWGSVASGQQAQAQVTIMTHGGSIVLKRGSQANCSLSAGC
jgi:hypothetical protein